jgi:hypothetical protein
MIFVSILFDYSGMYSSRAPPSISCNFDSEKQPFRVLREAHGLNHLVPSIPSQAVITTSPPVWGIVGRLRELETRPAGSRGTLPLRACAGRHDATGESRSALLLRGVFTARLTRHVRNVPSGAGRSGVPGSPSASPNHAGQSGCSRITGIRSCSSTISAFALVVTMVKVRRTVPSG